MRDNYHQFEEMKALAASLGPRWRLGAPWLFLSGNRDPSRNREILEQRLPATIVAELNGPMGSCLERPGDGELGGGQPDGSPPFAACIGGSREFHVDPYGALSFCCFVKDPAFRYDLRSGTVREGWEVFIPSLADRATGGEAYPNGCGSCEERHLCLWCPVYAYLEHGHHDAPVEYLCEVARECRLAADTKSGDHRRYFGVGGITIQVDSDLPMTDATFGPKIRKFGADGPGPDTVRIHHHFGIPDLPEQDRGEEVYRRPPWAVYRKGPSWVYAGIPTDGTLAPLHRLAVFSDDHSCGEVFNDEYRTDAFRRGPLGSLTMFPTDQIWLARLLADRNGCILHSCGAAMNGKGLLFVGHSEAGKTTTARLLEPHAEILCDDRNIVRHQDGQWRIFGTWSHGELPAVSPRPAPLHAMCFIEKATGNRITPIEDRREIVRRLLATVIRPLMTAEWWEKTLTVVERMAREIPAYRMEFDKSGSIVAELRRL
jgi:hypothetical protein